MSLVVAAKAEQTLQACLQEAKLAGQLAAVVRPPSLSSAELLEEEHGNLFQQCCQALLLLCSVDIVT